MMDGIENLPLSLSDDLARLSVHQTGARARLLPRVVVLDQLSYWLVRQLQTTTAQGGLPPTNLLSTHQQEPISRREFEPHRHARIHASFIATQIQNKLKVCHLELRTHAPFAWFCRSSCRGTWTLARTVSCLRWSTRQGMVWSWRDRSVRGRRGACARTACPAPAPHTTEQPNQSSG